MSGQATTPATPSPRSRVAPEIATAGDAALVRVIGMIDEHFPGFGDLTGMRTVVLDLSSVSFMTSFGVRQWLLSMAAIPPTVSALYLLGCPSVIVDQLNMILNFGGSAKIWTLSAPFMCPSCATEAKVMIDVLAEGADIARGVIAQRPCPRCATPMEFDEIPEAYFACLRKYGATGIEPAAAALVADRDKLRMKGIAPRPGTKPAPAPPANKRSMGLLGWGAIVLLLALIGVGAYLLIGPPS